MDSLNLSTGEVFVGVPSKLSTFTFVPAVQKLPIKNIFTEEGRCGALTEKPDKNGTVSHEKTSRKSLSDGKLIRAELVLINDSVEGGAGNVTLPQLKTSAAHASLSQTKSSLSIGAQSENTPNHAAAGTASMETGADKHRDISQQQCHNTSSHIEVSLGCCANRTPGSEDILSPADSADLLPTLASSRESILSDASDREKSWSNVWLSSVTSPASLSRTISPCSSVRSGVFTPSVIQVKKHFLAPGSSLIHIPQTCFSSCDSLSSSVCSQNPPPRHRPPLTRLSLLTAILRKGRLPVLSSALQRPYTPCWPVNPVTLSFCSACSAASSVASIPLEFSSRFSSLASIDIQSHHCRDPTCQSNELNRTCTPSKVQRRSEPVKSYTLPRAPVFCSNFHSASPPPKHEETVCTTSKTLPLTHISISKLPELKPDTFLKGSVDNNLKKLISPSPKLINGPQTSTAQKWSRKPNSSLSKLRWLSQQLRSSPVFPPHVQPFHSCATIFPTQADTASPLPPARNPTGRCKLERSHFDPRGATHSQGIRKAPCLSPSCYTPIAFSGWPSPTSSPTPTPSPAPPIRDLTPSPFSLRSTPSPRPGSGISDCSDREGKKRKTHKITLSYKSLAAIPTNTLLLDQQAIDEQVEREMSSCDTLDTGVASDTHTEMCSPAQLRQQSEELYAVIDEILANSIAASPRSSTTNNGLQPKNSSFSKSLGRETKYASLCSLHPSANVERKLLGYKQTKPGVVRPMTAIPRLTTEDKDEFHPKPFRQFASKQTLTDKKRVENKCPDEVGKDSRTGTKGKTLREERKPERRSPFSQCDLHIREPDEQLSCHGKGAPASFSSTERHREAFEALI